MCMSPHELTTARIEEIIQHYKEKLTEPGLRADLRRRWEWVLENYEKLLKERAEAGTY